MQSIDLILFYTSVEDVFEFIEFVYFCHNSILLFLEINLTLARDFFKFYMVINEFGFLKFI